MLKAYCREGRQRNVLIGRAIFTMRRIKPYMVGKGDAERRPNRTLNAFTATAGGGILRGEYIDASTGERVHLLHGYVALIAAASARCRKSLSGGQ